MQKICSYILSRKVLFNLLLIFILAFAASLINRPIESDENWFGEESYWLLKEGVVRLKSMPTILNFDTRVYVYYKLFVITGSCLIWIFGWSVWLLKFFVFLLYILFIILFKNWLKSSLIGFNSHQRILTLFFLITTPLMIGQTFIFRPEIPMMLLGFLSFSFIHKGLKKNKLSDFALGGLFAGLSFLIHLNGNIVVIAGFIFILSYKKFKPLAIYSLVSGFVCLLYFFDLTDQESFKAFMYQLINWPDKDYVEINRSVFTFLLNKITGLLSEHMRFFWSPRVFYTSALFFVCLFFGFKELKKKYPELLRYFLILVLCLNIFGSFIAERYIVYYLPFMVFIIGFTIYHYLRSKTSRIFPSVILILFGFQIITVILKFNSTINFKPNSNLNEFNHFVQKQIPKNSKILAPWEFIYNNIADYKIVSYKNIEYYKHQAVSLSELSEIIKLLNVDFIIVSPEFYRNVKVDEKIVIKEGLFDYKPIYFNEDFLVLKSFKSY